MVDNVPNRSIKKVGVLGAGLMGHGIAHTVAISGLEVVMIDTSMENLEYALGRIKTIMHIDLKKKNISDEGFESAINRITISDNYNMLDGCESLP